jgi:cell division protein FtsZ
MATKGQNSQKVKKVKRVKKLPTRKRRVSISKQETIRLPRPKIKIIGIGGGGSSIVAEIASGFKKVHFLAANTDLQALKKIAKVCKVFPFGEETTHNLGTGMDAYLGEMAAQKARKRIEKLFQGVDLTILVVSLGGGTGSGASPVFAEAAKKAGSSVLGVFTLPFEFEGEKKNLIAKKCLEKITPFLEGLILISNQRIFRLIDKKTPLQEALSKINQIFNQSLGSLIELLYSPNLINIDFSDLKTILKGKEKLAYLQSVEAEGEDRAIKIGRPLFQNPLYEYELKNPKRVLFGIAGDKYLKISEVEKIARLIYEKNPQAKIIFGISQRSSYGKKIKVTLLALGDKEKKGFKKKEPLAVISREPRVAPKTKRQSEKQENEKQKDDKQKDEKQRNDKQKNDKQKEQEGGLGPEAVKKRTLSQADTGAEKASPSKSDQEIKKILPDKKDKFLLGKRIKLKDKTIGLKKIGNNKRRSALDIKKEIRKIEKELLDREAKWDKPAFLRKKI